MNQKLKSLVVGLMFLIFLNNIMTNSLLYFFITIAYCTFTFIYEDGNYTSDMV